MAVEARCFLDGQGFSARFADFVPRKMKYVALIAACPSEDRRRSENSGSGKLQGIGRRHEEMQCFPGFEEEHRDSTMTN